MPWAKLDDSFYDNAKVIEAGNEAIGCYCRALSYSSRHLTDGFIPAPKMSELAARKTKVIQTLVAHRLIEELDNGYWIPDYLEYNMESEKAKEERAKAKARMAELRAERRASVRGKTA